jgi:putative heme-binding domain-containing protein
LSGLIVEQTPGTIVLRDAKGQRTSLPVAEVQEIKDSDVSLMPESLYREFSPEQLRDLFSFIQH